MLYTDVLTGDTIVNRNGSTAVVKSIEVVKPSAATFNNPVKLSFEDGSYGYYTESLNLTDGLEAPLDIVVIEKETAALFRDVEI